MAVLSSLSGCSMLMEAKWTAQNTLTGTNYNPITNSGDIRKSQTFGTAVANAALGGADQLISYILTIVGGGTTTLDVTALTNILAGSATLARIKGYMIRLLSVADDATNGTACTSITVGAAATNVQRLNLSSDTAAFNVKSGGGQMYFDQSAGGQTVDGTHKDLKIVNNDGAVSAKVEITLIGGGT